MKRKNLVKELNAEGCSLKRHVSKKTRAGWEEVFKKYSHLDISVDDTEWLDAPLVDEEAWEW